MPVSNRSSPAGSELISFSVEHARRHPPDRPALEGSARPQDLLPQLAAPRSLAAPLQNCCANGESCEAVGPCQIQVRDWFALAPDSLRPLMCISSLNHTQHISILETCVLGLKICVYSSRQHSFSCNTSRLFRFCSYGFSNSLC